MPKINTVYLPPYKGWIRELSQDIYEPYVINVKFVSPDREDIETSQFTLSKKGLSFWQRMWPYSHERKADLWTKKRIDEYHKNIKLRNEVKKHREQAERQIAERQEAVTNFLSEIPTLHPDYNASE